MAVAEDPKIVVDFPMEPVATPQQIDPLQIREGHLPMEEAKKYWDLFGLGSDESDERRDSAIFKKLVQLIKIFVYVGTFCIVLGCAFMSKASLLLMTTAIEKEASFPICMDKTGLERDNQYVVKLSDPERRGWIWCLVFSLCFPEVLTFLRSIRICVFKNYKIPRLASFLMVFTSESLHVIGIVLVVFLVFPYLHFAKALSLSSAVCIVPSILNLISNWNSKCSQDSWLKSLFDVVATLCQASGFILYMFFATKNQHQAELWLCSIGLILISCAWWENFVSDNSSELKYFVAIKKDLEDSRHFTYIFISLWKLILIFISSLACLTFSGENIKEFFLHFKDSFKTQNIVLHFPWTERDFTQKNSSIWDITNLPTPPPTLIVPYLMTNAMLPVVVAAVHVVASYLCYSCGKFVCKVCIQEFSYALPISLTVPVTLCVLYEACSIKFKSDCTYDFISSYIFWKCPKEELPYFFQYEAGFVSVLWILSQVWITLHIWTPKSKRMASTNELFVSPMYSSVFIDQSLALNRRKYQVEESSTKVEKQQWGFASVTRIFACATMWHETPDEMEQLLKSIMRMDQHQCLRRAVQSHFDDIQDPEYYEVEVHIFFDDAFVISEEDDEKMVINSFVKDFIVAVDTAVRKIYNEDMKLDPPIKVPTPYGGRLIWTLKGDNILIVHLKNKELIRHKKRWSQVMYMYYLLGYQLLKPEIPLGEREQLAKNTYILALDGDIDFKPDAVQLLVDLMNRNENLGAACGRIHPVGTGMMVYYQKFEYAIGHWLQKATEHMIGCVLCSPGCFSLFRASALMKDNVIRRYATLSKEAIEYVQFDQGEDRWLCTLLLQSGSRVEYSAASDAYTHCPESFAEFYTQRRRWAPSTMANIMDLLVNYKKTVACNDNISLLYIGYQLMLMVGTILGPGTIFLMLVGAMVSAFGISNWQSFVANLIPIAFFILLCFLAKNDTQILVAQIFSAAYALLMMAVLVGISMQLVIDGLSSPSALFLLSMTGSFIIAALVHPQEFWCVVHGLIYFLSVPSMYLLLALYSIINLHVVSWGTREVQVKKSKKQMQQEQLQAQAVVSQKSQKSGWLSFLDDKRLKGDEEDGGISFGLANLFRCMCCTYPKSDATNLHLMRIGEQLDAVNKQIASLQKQVESSSNKVPNFRRRSSIQGLQKMQLDALAENEDTENEDESDDAESNESEEHMYNQPDQGNNNEYWLSDEALKGCPIKRLSNEEEDFWIEFIHTYLYPLPDKPEEKAKVARQLVELRNKVVFGILMLNSLFILIVFLLQMQKDILHVEWPFNGKANITYLAVLNEVRIDIEYLQLEPINLVLVFFFSLILVVQFIAMLFHRFQTMSHILASTELNLCSKDMATKENFITGVVDQLQRLNLRNDDAPEDESEKMNNAMRRRSTIHMLEKKRQEPQQRSLSIACQESLKKLLKQNPKIASTARKLSTNFEAAEFVRRKPLVRSSSSHSTMTVSSPRSSTLFDIERQGISNHSTRVPTPRTSMFFDVERQGTPMGLWDKCYYNPAFDDGRDTDSVGGLQMVNVVATPSPLPRRTRVNAEMHPIPQNRTEEVMNNGSEEMSETGHDTILTSRLIPDV